MDGSNPIVSGANILGGSGAITIPTQVREVYSIPVEEDRALCCACFKKRTSCKHREHYSEFLPVYRLKQRRYGIISVPQDFLHINAR